MSTSRSLRQPSAARANSVKSRSDLQIASSRRARPAPAQLILMHASRERLRLARTRRRRGRALADGLGLGARRARRAGHRVSSCPSPFGRTRRLREPTRLAMPSTQTRPMARPQQGTQRLTRHSTPSRDDGVERRDKRAPKRNARCGGQMRWRSLSVLHARHRKGSPQEVMSSPRPMGATAKRWPSSTSALSRMVVLAWEMSWPASRSSLAGGVVEQRRQLCRQLP